MNKIKNIIIIFCLIILSFTNTIHAEVNRIIGEVRTERDSDHINDTTYFLGYRYSFNDPLNMQLGSYIGNRKIKDNNDIEKFDVLKLEYKADPLSILHLSLQGSLLQGDNWSPELFDVNLACQPNKKWYLEGFTNRELVNSFTSIQNEYLSDVIGVSADYTLLNEYTFVGTIYSQSISDGNDRLGKIFKIVYSPEKLNWFNIQILAKGIDGEFDGVGYFGPEEVREYQSIVGLSQSFFNDNWTAKLKLGIGRQEINDLPSKRTHLEELEIKGWFTSNLGLKVLIGRSDFIENFTGNYYRNYGSFAILVSW